MLKLKISIVHMSTNLSIYVYYICVCMYNQRLGIFIFTHRKLILQFAKQASRFMISPLSTCDYVLALRDRIILWPDSNYRINENHFIAGNWYRYKSKKKKYPESFFHCDFFFHEFKIHSLNRKYQLEFAF